MKFHPDRLDFGQIGVDANGRHLGVVESDLVQSVNAGLLNATVQITGDDSGGRFKLVNVSVFALEFGPGPGHKPMGFDLVDESDGTEPVNVSKGEKLRVTVEYFPENAPVPVDTFSAVLSVSGTRPGKHAVQETIPLLASRVRSILLVLDGKFTRTATGRPIGNHYASFGPGDLALDEHADDYFGLSTVVRTLHQLPLFKIMKAHRDTDPTDFNSLSSADRVLLKPDFENFKFDQHDLNALDEMWLFGVGGPNETSFLSETELMAIAAFMNAGGGVFATGDHEDLGLPLCGRIMRVRSMRKWYFNNPGPDGEPLAPPGGSGGSLAAERIDTTQPGHRETSSSPNFAFDNQSDDIPQPITATPAGSTHPLLALPGGGLLGVLPDHMHEGEVIDPFDPQFQFSATLTYNKGNTGQRTFVEYPLDASGHQVRPQILALGTVLGGHTTQVSAEEESFHSGSGTPTKLPSRNFGVIGAYDGHKAGVGRVCVDSTWHHFFDINLIGDPAATEIDHTVVPPVELGFEKRKGFTASSQGRAHLANIESYYLNIARWLVRAPK
jgi:hypothetical protein